MCKIINKHRNELQMNPELRKTFQYNLFVVFKRNLQEVIGSHEKMKNENLFKTNLEKCEGKCESCNTNHHYFARRSLTLLHSEVTKHSNYT